MERKILFTLIASTFFVQGLRAQFDQTLYGFDAVPQSVWLNPALQPKAKVAVGFPAISSLYLNFHNTGFTAGDLFEKGTDINENKDRVLRNLRNDDYIALEQRNELLFVGVEMNKGYLSLGVRQQLDFQLTYPADFLRLLNDGTGDSTVVYKDFSLDEFNVNANAYLTYHVGYSHHFMNDKLIAGLRFKYFSGIGNVKTDMNQAYFRVNQQAPYSYTIRSDFTIHTGGFDSYTDDDEDKDGGDFVNDKLLGSKNKGIGFDLGFQYEVDDRLSVAGSILDLGSYIKWDDDLKDYQTDTSFFFDGFDVIVDVNDTANFAEDLLDSLENTFDFKETKGRSYTTYMNTRFILSARYKLTKRHSFGLQLYGEQRRSYDDRFIGAVTLNYYGDLTRWFQWKLSYTMHEDTYDNMGLGISLKGGPIQLYLIGDNLLDIAGPKNFQQINFRMGLNVAIFGRDDKKKKKMEYIRRGLLYK